MGRAFARLHHGEHGGSEHDGSGVVGHEDGDDGADEIDEREEMPGRSVGAVDGDIGHPVENAVIAGEFREEHHAGQEEIDVETFSDRIRRLDQVGSV